VAAGGAAASSASPHYAARIKVAWGERGERERARERAGRAARVRTRIGAREGWCAVFGTAATEGAADRWTSGA